MTPKTRSRARGAAIALPFLSLFVLALAGPAAAQNKAPQDTSIDPQLFQPAIGPQNFLTVEGAQVPDHKRLSFGLSLNYQQRPYTVFTLGAAPGETHVIDNQLTGELDAAIGLFGKYQFGIGLPFTPYLDGDEISPMGVPANLHLTESGIGDLRLEGKAHLATLGDDDQYDLAISAGLTLPTGHTGGRDYLGDKTVTGRIKAIATLEVGPMRAAANLGLLIRETSDAFATQLGPQILYGAAAAYAVDKKTDVILEMFGRSGLNQFASFYNDVNPFEIDLAGRRSINGMWSVTGGLGRGLGNGIGAPDLRLFLGAAFNPDYRDRDHDGIYDINDKCPDQPEDRDGFQDEDGCPDPDNDNDGIPDALDKCPNDPEDVDEFQDADGCPDLDNDGDGIPDAIDKCPMQPETLNGIKDDDGCPDPGPEWVRLAEGKIEVDPQIGFVGHGDKLVLRGESTKVVNDVALVMKGHPEIGRLRIEVKTQGVPKLETQKRADAVRDFLVSKGVDVTRLDPVGLGAGPSHVDFLIEAALPKPAPAPQAAPTAAPRPPASTLPATAPGQPASSPPAPQLPPPPSSPPPAPPGTMLPGRP